MLGEPGDMFSLICSIGTSAICLRLKTEHLPSLQSQRQGKDSDRCCPDDLQDAVRALSYRACLRCAAVEQGEGMGGEVGWGDGVCGGIFSDTLSSYFSSS